MAYVLMIICVVALAVLGFLLVQKFRALSRLQRRTKALEQQAAALSTIYATIPDLVFCKDLDGFYTSCNPSFEQFAGCAEYQLIGKRDIDIFRVDTQMAEQFMAADLKVLREQKTETIEEIVTFPDGEKCLMETTKTPMYQDGKITGLMGISRDITHRKAAEDAKNRFLSHMSHEIRTPLNAIVGLSQIVKDFIDDRDKALEFMDKIMLSSHHLAGILTDILDLSKIESGNMILTRKPFHLWKACREVNHIIHQQCSEKGLRYHSDIEAAVGYVTMGDMIRLKQVMINLLSNAVKYTPPGGTVSFDVVMGEETEDDVTFSFSISDTGVGISEEELPCLFSAFEQADQTLTTPYGGAGLGLSISQSLIVQMGSKIKVESEPGKGSRFFFDLTFPKEAEPEPEPSPEDFHLELTGRRILLAEDVETNRMVVQAMLADSGVEIVEAVDGKQAVELFAGSENGHFDLIFMDIQMPVMDGYEATKRIRALPHPQARDIPIIAMTANAYDEDVQLALASGMNSHMAKPLQQMSLMEATAEALHIDLIKR